MNSKRWLRTFSLLVMGIVSILIVSLGFTTGEANAGKVTFPNGNSVTVSADGKTIKGKCKVDTSISDPAGDGTTENFTSVKVTMPDGVTIRPYGNVEDACATYGAPATRDGTYNFKATKSGDHFSVYVYGGSYQDLHHLNWKVQLVFKGGIDFTKTSQLTFSINNSMYSLENAQYGVFATKAKAKTHKASNALKTFKTDANGKHKTAKDFIDEGKYWIAEISSSRGYVRSSNVFQIEIKADKFTTASDKETPQNAIIKLYKKDKETGKTTPQGNAALAGAQFTIHYYKGTYNLNNLPGSSERHWVMKTDSSGTITMDASHKVSGSNFYTDTSGKPCIPLGTITVEETQEPTGYLRNTTKYLYHITSSGTAEHVTFNAPTITETPKRGGVSVVKADDTLARSYDQGDADWSHTQYAEYTIYNLSTNPVRVDGRDYSKNAAVKTIKATWDGSKFIAATATNCLPYGKYKIVETKAPNGYTKSNWEKTFDITSNGQMVKYTTSSEGWNVDTVWRGNIELTKYDDGLNRSEPEGDADLSGISYDIINRSKKAVVSPENGTSLIEPGGVVCRITTKKVGNVYKASTAYTGTNRLHTGGTNTWNIPTNKPGQWTGALAYGTYEIVEVGKTDAATTDANDSYLLGSYASGGQKIWKKTGIQIRQNGQLVPFNDALTNANITQANTSTAASKHDGDYDRVKRGTLRVQKYDFDKIQNNDISRAPVNGSIPQGDTTLEGFEFTVTNESAHPIVYYHDGTSTEIARGGTFKIYTNAKGIATTDTKALPYGTYSVRETKVPDGWTIDRDWFQKFTIRKDGQLVSLTDDPINGQTYQFKPVSEGSMDATVTGTGQSNYVWRGMLEIQKRDLERFTGRATKNAEPEGDATLEGFVFRVYNDSKHTIRYYKTQDKSQYQDIVKGGYFELTTNDKGYVSTVANALPYGTYHIIEQSVPDGYYRDASWRQDFTVRKDGQVISITNDPVTSKRYTTTVLNQPVAAPMNSEAAIVYGTGPANQVWRGDIDVWKVDADLADNTDAYAHQNQGMGVFSGCRIAVFNASEYTIRYDKDGTGTLLQEVEPGGFVDAKITDANGHVHFSGLPYGRYTVKEISSDEWLAANGDLTTLKQLSDPRSTTWYSTDRGCYLLPLDSSVTVPVAKPGTTTDGNSYRGDTAVPKAKWQVTTINKGTADKEVASSVETNNEAGQTADAFRNRIQHGDYYVYKVGFIEMLENDPDSAKRVAVEGIKFHIYNYNRYTDNVVVKPGGSTGHKEDAGRVAEDLAVPYKGTREDADRILRESNFTDPTLLKSEVCVVTTDSQGIASTRVTKYDGSTPRWQINGWTTPAKWLPNGVYNGANYGYGSGDNGALAAGDYLVVEEIPQEVQDRWIAEYGTILLPVESEAFTITRSGEYIDGTQLGHWSLQGEVENFVPQVHFHIYKTTLSDNNLIPLAASFKIQKVEKDDNGNETYKTMVYEDNYHNLTDTWTTLDNRNFEGTRQMKVPTAMPQDNYIIPTNRTAAIPGSVASPDEFYLPYGEYRVIEINSPDGYRLTDREIRFVVDDYYDNNFEIKIYFKNEPQMGKIYLYKTDDSADIPEGVNRKVNVEGIEYKVYADEDIYTTDGTLRYHKNDYIQTISTTAENDYYAVTKELYVGLPVADEVKGNLPVTEYDGARYRIEEIKAPSDTTSQSPYGYILNTEPIYVTLNFDRAKADAANPADRLVVSYATAGPNANETNTIADTPQKGKVQITKKDAGTGKIVNQSDTDIVFGVYADTDIYTPPYTYYKAGELVDTVTIHKGEESAWSKDLYVGHYYVQELTAPYGYILDSDEPSSNVARKHYFTIDYTGQDKDTATFAYVTVENQPQMGKITITKTDSETGALLPGAVFNVICDADIITADGTLRVSAGDIVDTITTGADGKATTKELFLGSYHLEEVGPLKLSQNLDPTGVLGINGSQFSAKLATGSNATSALSITAGRKGIPELVTVNGEAAKEAQTVSAGDTLVFHDRYAIPNVLDLFIGQEMTNKTDGGKASLSNTDDKLVFNDGTNTYNVASIDRVHSTVTLESGGVETICSYEITVTGKTMTLKLSIPKSGEGEEVTYDEKLFEGTAPVLSEDIAYNVALTNNLTLVSGKMWFSGYEDEAVELASDGSATLKDEIKASSSNEGTSAKEYASGSYTNSDIAPGQYVITFEGDVSSVKLTHYSKTVESGQELSGEATVTSGETITFNEVNGKNSIGEAVNNLDTLESSVAFTLTPVSAQTEPAQSSKWNGDIHIDVEFTVKVADGISDKKLLNPYTYVNYGYNVNTTKYPVTLEYAGQTVSVTTSSADATNQPTPLEITKVDATNGKELPGAHIEITDNEGNVVDSWVSTEETHIIKGLVPGTYVLTETIAVKTYEKATSITFEVKNDGTVNACEMKDEPIEIEGEIDKYQSMVSYENRNYQYGIDYRSTSNTWADELVMEDKLEVANAGYAKVEYVKTPVSFDDWDGYMNIWYKTNKTDADYSDDAEKYNASATNPFNPWVPNNSRVVSYKGWKIWKANVTTYKSEILEVKDLGLAEDEYITGLRFEHGRVESGFTTRENGNEYWNLDRSERYGENDNFTSGIILMYQETFDLAKAANPALHNNEWTKSYHYEPVVLGMVATDKAFEKDGTILENSAIMGVYRNGGGSTTEEKEKLSDEDKDRVVQELHGTPDIGTMAAVDGEKYDVTAGGEVHMVDTVKYTGLTPGREYRMEGRLMNAETGQPALQPDGSEIIASATFVPTSHSGEVDVLFTFNARALEFTRTVVFEEGLYIGSKPEVVPESGKTMISKTDIAGEVELPGAILTVKDSNGEIVESWISAEIPHQIALADGKYTLIENRAPLGYDVSEEMEFEVSLANTILTDNKVVMKDAPLEGSEDIIMENKMVASHSDMSDEGQTVEFGEDDIADIVIMPTGDSPLPFVLVTIGCLSGVFGYAYYRRRMTRK